MKQLQMIVIALAVALLTGTVATSLQAADPKAPEAPVVIDGCKAKKEAVSFNHTSHTAALKKAGKDTSCNTCHHTGETDKKCSECHKEAQGEIGACTEMSPKKNPYHAKCITCHKEMQATFAAAPTKCADCHK